MLANNNETLNTCINSATSDLLLLPVPYRILYTTAVQGITEATTHCALERPINYRRMTTHSPRRSKWRACRVYVLTRQNNNGHMRCVPCILRSCQINQISKCMAMDVGIACPRRTHRLGTQCIPPKTDPAERGGDVPWLIRELIVNLSINQSIYFAIKGHRPLTNHTSSTIITTERKAKLYTLCRYRYNVS